MRGRHGKQRKSLNEDSQVGEYINIWKQGVVKNSWGVTAQDEMGKLEECQSNSFSYSRSILDTFQTETFFSLFSYREKISSC